MSNTKDAPTPPDIQRWGERAVFNYHERAAIYEYHGGMTRQEAERRAREYVTAKYGRQQGRLL